MARMRPPSVRWRRRGLLAFVLAIAAYAFFTGRGFAHGGSRAGLVFGTLALAAVLALLYFGVRKRSYRSSWGTLESWLQAHVYLGLLAPVLVLLHTGFRFQDRVAVAAFVVMLVVVASGVVGALLYDTVPRRLSAVESDLSPAEMAAQLNQLARAMARLAAARSPAFQQVCSGLLAEARPRRLAGWRLLAGAGGLGALQAGGRRGTAEAGAPWAAQLPRVPAAEQEELRQLLVLARQHRELAGRLVAQQRFRNVLDAWLYLHVPLSIALLVLIAAHLVAVFYFSRV
jgi:predicted ferric reductase